MPMLTLGDFQFTHYDASASTIVDGAMFYQWPAHDGEDQVLVLIAATALDDRLDHGGSRSATGRKARLSLLEHRATIEAAARRLYKPGDHQVRLTSADF